MLSTERRTVAPKDFSLYAALDDHTPINEHKCLRPLKSYGYPVRTRYSSRKNLTDEELFEAISLESLVERAVEERLELSYKISECTNFVSTNRVARKENRRQLRSLYFQRRNVENLLKFWTKALDEEKKEKEEAVRVLPGNTSDTEDRDTGTYG